MQQNDTGIRRTLPNLRKGREYFCDRLYWTTLIPVPVCGVWFNTVPTFEENTRLKSVDFDYRYQIKYPAGYPVPDQSGQTYGTSIRHNRWSIANAAIIEITIFSTYNYSFLTLFPSILIESGFLSDPDPEKPGSGTLNSE